MDTSIFLLYGVLVVSAAWFLLRGQRLNKALDNIPGPSSQSWLKGNIKQFFNRHAHEFQTQVALNYGPVVKLHGLFGRPLLFVSDPKALNTIVLKEEHIFEEGAAFLLMNRLIFGPGLVATLGEQHRKQRKMLNPVFSVNHMRHMLPIFYNIMFKLRDAISAQIRRGKTEINMLEWTGRAALELIGQGGLGYSFDPLVSEMNDEYGDAMKSVIPSVLAVDVLLRILPSFHSVAPAWLRRPAIDIFPNAHVQKLKSIADLMSKKSVEIFENKKAALKKGDEAVTQQVGEGKDIMSILMKANSAASEDDRLPEDELIGQMSTLIFAGMDTTSNTLVHILHLLAENLNIQDKLREEIQEAGAGANASYDDLNQLPLLNAVCRETLRLFPAGSTVIRVPNKDTVLPLSQPVQGLDGALMNEIPVSKGTEVLLGLWGCNVNKAVWGEDSLEWKPERWLSELPTTVTDAPIPGVYSNLMTFMGGKRACIGFKFSEMEMKTMLSVLVSTFVFEPTGKPIEWNLAPVAYPTVGKDSNIPQLPLKVKLYAKA